MTSWVASCELGGKRCMSSKTSANVPQVVGKELESTRELIDGFGKEEEGDIGKE